MGIRDGLLVLLGGGPKYGYQPKGEFEQATGEAWPLNVGQVYTTLQRLARDELVANRLQMLRVASLTLVGTGPAFRSRYLAIHTLILTSVGIAAGLVVGTVIRFAVDDGFYMPWVVFGLLIVMPLVRYVPDRGRGFNHWPNLDPPGPPRNQAGVMLSATTQPTTPK